MVECDLAKVEVAGSNPVSRSKVFSSIRAIAKGLKRAPSTVSQEVHRHGGRGRYGAVEADLAAWDSGRRPKLCLLSKNLPLQRLVAGKLKEDGAPQQIAGWLKTEYPKNPELWVSPETIYRSLFVQARGALKRELIGHLRTKRRLRRSRHATARGEGRGEIVDAVSMRQRPAEIEDRAIPGHGEGDLVEGSLSHQTVYHFSHTLYPQMLRGSKKRVSGLNTKPSG